MISLGLGQNTSTSYECKYFTTTIDTAAYNSGLQHSLQSRTRGCIPSQSRFPSRPSVIYDRIEKNVMSYDLRLECRVSSGFYPCYSRMIWMCGCD